MVCCIETGETASGIAYSVCEDAPTSLATGSKQGSSDRFTHLRLAMHRREYFGSYMPSLGMIPS